MDTYNEHDMALRACLLPLDSNIDLSQFSYRPHTSRGESMLWRQLETPLNVGGIETNELPAVFEIIGQISPDDCCLSAHANRAKADSRAREDECKYTKKASGTPAPVSCWVQPREGISSRIQWKRYIEALNRLVNHTGYTGDAVIAFSLFRDYPNLPAIRVRRDVPRGAEVSLFSLVGPSYSMGHSINIV
ncbi:hypothetical protein NLI96_g12681 [Meripilus lineatus]|uniref:Uncharacterized protein n=1 Tax=Meripilus lineatus TaxID=2056292 RepID=A0AAD5Y7Z2_9APHY|nr:hypothetical protein NLI96_g12681 [Physisporinus lineatus]